ncbi:hypothetical protein JCM10908_004919 [Rhodotorula pacifica]|uniref:uncharacterized protein n=1 Tax=Rhodotorula pacifica TaxID=1495444 RepID=UPI003179DE8C
MATAAVLTLPQTYSIHSTYAYPAAPWRPLVVQTRTEACSPNQTTTTTRGRPARGRAFQLLHSLPTELLELTFEYLGFADLLRVRCVDRSLNRILADARHYHNVSLSQDRLAGHAELAERLRTILPGTRHLVLRSFPSACLSTLLPACSHRLTSLDLSFSSVRDQELLLLAGPRPQMSKSAEPTAGSPLGSPLANLRSLKLKGCRRISDFLTLLFDAPDDPDVHSSHAPLARLTNLDLSWSAISSLPHPLATHLPALVSLNLSTTPYLRRKTLLGAISSLPVTLSTLDLSHLNLTVKDLSKLAFLPPSSPDGEVSPARHTKQTALSSPRGEKPLRLILAGNDNLTLSSLSHLERHRSTALRKRPIEIEHGGLMLESDEEEDVRRFVEMVAGVVMREGRNAGDRPVAEESDRSN